MGGIYELDGLRPVVHETAFVHPSATLIGDVIIGADCFVGPSAVMRGDIGRIEMRAGANFQDTCVAHCFPGETTLIEEDGHIGHGAILHGCHVGRNALVGMNAVVMDGAVIGESAIVAALAFVKAGFVVPPRTIVAGSPAKVLREATDEEIAWKHEGTLEYQEITRRCRATLKSCEPLREVEPDRPRFEGSGTIPLYKTRGSG